jgi:predicted nucleic acid-binding protein
MILLDTNVVSESWKPQPDRAVASWLNSQPVHSLYLCTPVLAELRFGIERLPHGRRRAFLASWVARLESEAFRDRILPLDSAAAAEFGRLAARREKLGRRMEPMDALIAGIAASQAAGVATRDTSHFEDLGLELINPFEAPADR